MQNSKSVWLVVRWAMLLVSLMVISGSIGASGSFAAPQTPGAGDVPVVKADAGPCDADFVITDGAGKGVYDAKIEIQIRYRFGGFHRIDAKVGTNVDGKARVEGLPEQIKNAAEFTVTHEGVSKSVPYDPQTDCHAKHAVNLGGK